MMVFIALLMIPLIIALLARNFLKDTITWQEMGAQMGIMCVVLAATWGIAMFAEMSEVQVNNGEIVSKHRDHGHYIESYQCNCITTCTGGKNSVCTTVCQTCFRDHYTVDWYTKTTIGNIRLQYFDRLSRSVYKSPDPAIYTNAFVGEPCSIETRGLNYIKAAPKSLFNLKDMSVFERFADKIPAYPEVYSIYQIDRVLGVGVALDPEWNTYFDNKVKRLSPAKDQVNPIVVVVDTADQMYKEALEHAWLGASGNDVVVIIGSENGDSIDWVDGFTVGRSAGNHLLLAKVRDKITSIGTLSERVQILDTITQEVQSEFALKDMDEFKYLRKDISPPTWVTVSVFLLAFIGSGVLTFVFHRNEFTNRRVSRYYRSY